MGYHLKPGFVPNPVYRGIYDANLHLGETAAAKACRDYFFSHGLKPRLRKPWSEWTGDERLEYQKMVKNGFSEKDKYKNKT